MTDLHRELQLATLTWLSSRTTRRGCASSIEIPFWDYIVDAGGLCRLQNRFWNSYNQKQEQPNDLLCIFEVKVSRNDYKRTFVKDGVPFSPARIASLEWIVTPSDIVMAIDIPFGWGWLIKRGNGLSEIIKPRYYSVAEANINKFAYAVLWSQKQSARNARIRKIKEYNKLKGGAEK